VRRPQGHRGSRRGFLAERGANIVEAQQYNDVETRRFFMRVEFSMERESVSASSAMTGFGEVAATTGWTGGLSKRRTASVC
jgi:formyltetrahydrofolate deformylase